MIGILSELQRLAIDKARHQLSDLGDYVASFVAIRGFMEDLGLFVKYHLAAMDSKNCDTRLQFSVATILGLVDVISAVIATKK